MFPRVQFDIISIFNHQGYASKASSDLFSMKYCVTCFQLIFCEESIKKSIFMNLQIYRCEEKNLRFFLFILNKMPRDRSIIKNCYYCQVLLGME
jgi:hypothetical protein